MRALRSRVPQQRCLNSEWRRALVLLASNPQGTTEHMLAHHGFSSDMLAMLVLAGLATVVSETPRAGCGKIERMLITRAGERALEG
jgi:hypothetical protein